MVRAETADPATEILYYIVTTNMIHGPFVLYNQMSLCMVDGKYSNNYPKSYVEEIAFWSKLRYPA